MLRLLLSPLPGNALSIAFHKRRGPLREAPLVLPLGGMEAVPSGLAAALAEAAPEPARQRRAGRAGAGCRAAGRGAGRGREPVDVADVVDAVLDRGAPAAPAPGCLAAGLARRAGADAARPAGAGRAGGRAGAGAGRAGQRRAMALGVRYGMRRGGVQALSAEVVQLEREPAAEAS